MQDPAIMYLQRQAVAMERCANALELLTAFTITRMDPARVELEEGYLKHIEAVGTDVEAAGLFGDIRQLIINHAASIRAGSKSNAAEAIGQELL